MSNVALGVLCALSASLHQLLEILFFHAGPIADFGEREDIAGVADLAYMRGNAQGHFLADRLLGGSNVHVLFELRDVDLEHRFDATRSFISSINCSLGVFGVPQETMASMQIVRKRKDCFMVKKFLVAVTIKPTSKIVNIRNYPTLKDN